MPLLSILLPPPLPPHLLSPLLPPSASFAGSSLHQTLLICQGGLVGFRRFSERHSFRAALSLCQALVRIVLLTVGLVLLPYSLSVSTTFFVILCFCLDYGGFSSVCHPSPFLQQGSCKEGGGHLSQGQFFGEGGGVLIRFSMDAQ